MSTFRPDRLAIVSIYAKDIPRTVHFYLDVVGLTLLQDHHNPVAFDIGGTYLVILPGEPSPSPGLDDPGFPLLTFAVDDIDAAVKHLIAHHAEITGGVRENNNTRWVLFHDPAGNLLEFAQFGG